MNKTLIKTICLIVVFSMTIAFTIGAVATLNSTSYLSDEIDEKIVAVTEDYANDFSAEFNHMEGLTDSLASYVATTLTWMALRQSRSRIWTATWKKWRR